MALLSGDSRDEYELNVDIVFARCSPFVGF